MESSVLAGVCACAGTCLRLYSCLPVSCSDRMHRLIPIVHNLSSIPVAFLPVDFFHFFFSSVINPPRLLNSIFPSCHHLIISAQPFSGSSLSRRLFLILTSSIFPRRPFPAIRRSSLITPLLLHLRSCSPRRFTLTQPFAGFQLHPLFSFFLFYYFFALFESFPPFHPILAGLKYPSLPFKEKGLPS